MKHLKFWLYFNTNLITSNRKTENLFKLPYIARCISPPPPPYLLLTHLSRVATANILLHSPRVNLHNKNQYTLGRIFASLPLTPHQTKSVFLNHGQGIKLFQASAEILEGAGEVWQGIAVLWSKCGYQWMLREILELFSIPNTNQQHPGDGLHHRSS